MATPYMQLDVPIPGVTPGPTYAEQITQDLNRIDEHDHSLGKGAPVPLISAGGLRRDASQALGVALDGDTLAITVLGLRLNNLGGLLSIGAPAPANDNGLAILGNVISSTPADATHPGHVTNEDQLFGGIKSFVSGLVSSSLVAYLTNALTLTGTTAAEDALTPSVVIRSSVARNPGTKILAVQNDTTDMLVVDAEGNILSTADVIAGGDVRATGEMQSNVYTTPGTGGLLFLSTQPGASAAVSHSFDTSEPVTDTAAQLLAVLNNGAEVFSVGPTGVVKASGFSSGLQIENPADTTTVVPDVSLYSSFVYVYDVGVEDVTVGAPTAVVLDALSAGRSITVVIRNSSGGDIVTTWDAVFKLALWESPETGYQASISFIFDGTNWVETGRSATNIPT